MSSPILRLENLTRDFGDFRAVDHLTLDVEAGEVFGFLGPNGAGKTTSISMICGLLAPSSGRVLLHNTPIRPGDPTLNRIGVCPQTITLWPLLTCLEQLTFIGEMYHIPRNEARKRGLELLGALGLAEKVNTLASKLSGGMLRRLNLLLALVHDPDLIVLDEPEAGLDPQSRVLVREYIQSMAKLKTVIFTTHNMDEADRVVDRVAIIDHGKLLALDTPHNLKSKYGKGETIELDWKSMPEDTGRSLGASLHEFPDATISPPRVTIRHPNASDALQRVLEIVRPICGSPARIQLRESTLEDVFLNLTGRELRE